MNAPTIFVEDDETRHQVLVFDPRPVGYSGFMGCVTHSLVMTDHGLFEGGRYPAVSLSSQSRYWQWFLHRRLVTPEEIHTIQDTYSWDHRELLQRAIAALTGLDNAD